MAHPAPLSLRCSTLLYNSICYTLCTEQNFMQMLQPRIGTPQRSRYKDEIPDFLFPEGLEKRRKIRKKKPQRSIYIKRGNARFFISDMQVQSKKYENFVFISRLTSFYNAQHKKLKNVRSSSLWTCLHHMVILKSQNKNTDF